MALSMSHPGDYNSFWAGFPGSSLFFMPIHVILHGYIFLKKTFWSWLDIEIIIIKKQIDECYPSFCKMKALTWSVVLFLLHLLESSHILIQNIWYRFLVLLSQDFLKEIERGRITTIYMEIIYEACLHMQSYHVCQRGKCLLIPSKGIISWRREKFNQNIGLFIGTYFFSVIHRC